jgi:hypothetical protein
MLHLRSLESPLMLLVEKTGTRHVASNCRALQEVRCRKEFKLIPEIGDDAPSAGIAVCIAEAVEWFSANFGTTR